MLGTFNNGQPKIPIEIKGKGSSGIIEAVVDSGFNGHLKIPYEIAFPLGLTLISVGSGIVADGNMSANLVCGGEVIVDGASADTNINVHPADIVLVGTSLLRDLKKAFYLDAQSGRVEVLDSPPMEKGFAAQKK